MTITNYSVVPCLGGYTVERLIFRRSDSMRLVKTREIAGVFLGEKGDKSSFKFAMQTAINLCNDLNKMLPIVEHSPLPIFKRPALLEQLAAL